MRTALAVQMNAPLRHSLGAVHSQLRQSSLHLERSLHSQGRKSKLALLRSVHVPSDGSGLLADFRHVPRFRIHGFIKSSAIFAMISSLSGSSSFWFTLSLKLKDSLRIV